MKLNYKKIVKYFSITFLSLILLLTIAIFSLKFPAVQNFVKDKLINYLEEKIQTKVQLDRVYVDFPNSLVMENFYLQGQDVDTLLYVKRFDVGLDIWQLFKSKADIKSIDLNGVNTTIVRQKDGSFNFDYILNAFATKDEKESDSKPFIISLNKIKLQDINVSFIDYQAANNIQIKFNSFETKIKKFDLEQNQYAIGDILFDGLKFKLKQNLMQEIAKKAEEKVEPSSEQKPLQLELNGIQLKNFDIDYGDDNSGIFAQLKWTNFETKIKKIDLQNNHYAVDDIDLDGLFVKLKQKNKQQQKTNEPEVDVIQKESPLKIELNKINLTNLNVDYGDEISKTFAQINLKQFETKINELGLDKNKFDIDYINLKDAKINANLHLVNQQSTSNTNTNSQPFNLILNKVTTENIQIKYTNTAIKRAPQGMDFNHLNFTKLNLDLRDFKMIHNEIEGSIKSASIQEGKGLNIQQFRTDFLYGETQTYLKNFYLKTPKTLLKNQVVLSYANQNQLTNHPEKITISADLNQSKIGFSDILYLVPDLKNTVPFNHYPTAVLNVDAAVRGKMNDILIQRLNVSGLDDLNVSANGRIKNATQPTHLFYDLTIQNLSTSSKTIYQLIPKNTLPENIRIPSKLSVKGKAKGTTEIINTQLFLTSSLGNANIDAKLDMRKKDAEEYDIKADLEKLDIGTLISHHELGKISAKFSVKGKSFNPEKANALINGKIIAAGFSQYVYQNIDLKAKINQGIFETKVDSKDSNAQLNLAASGVYKTDLTNVKLDGNISTLNLKKLGFYADPLNISGEINADFAHLNPDDLNGSLHLKNFKISDSVTVLPIDEIKLTAISSAEMNQLNLASQIADVELKGQFKLTQIGDALSQTINEYYQFQESNPSIKIDPHQYFTLNATIKNDDLIQRFVPDLKHFETISLNGTYNSDENKLNLEGQIPQLTFGENTIEDGKILIDNNAKTLNYDLSIEALKNESLQLNKISIDGNIEENVVQYNIKTKDEKEQTQFLLAGNIKTSDELTEIKLNENGLKLNYDSWKVGENNSIQLKKDGITAHNFSISKGNSQILVQSESEKSNSPLNIFIQDFKIETITELIKKEELPAAGTINGSVQLRDFDKQMMFNADMSITDLEVFGNPIGLLTAKVANSSPTLLNVDVNLSGNNNKVKLNGDFNTENSSFDFILDLNRFEMKAIQGFAMNQIKESEGYLSGKLTLTGKADKPSILGQIKFNEVGMIITETGSNFRKINDAIEFTSQGLEFNRFKINDNEGNSLTINGEVLTKTYQDFAFNLKANARDFKLINAPKSDDALMYGQLAVNANMGIKGDLDLPKVDGNITVTNDTNFTFVLPQTSHSLEESDGIVEFIDQNNLTVNKAVELNEINSTSKIKGLDVNVNIETDKEAKMTIIIDKNNGDFVEIQGEAHLTGGMDPSGKTTLVGVYQVEKGAYELSVSLLKRRFDIQKGSTITWTGEPTSANLNITAIYKTETAPIDLVQQQISGLSSNEMNQYKQRIPFNANLILNGELLKPIITFDITLNDNNPSIPKSVIDNTKAKLDQLRNDEAELNKQVFALLLLNRFVGENPFQSQSGVSAETMAKQSVSNLLSQQLNNLAADLIKGVDIDFGLDTEDDYSTGTKNTRTDLNVAVSKRLLNDRLKVSVGSNFGLEGEARENENTTNIAGNISVDYSLSRDGRYMLRAYRKDEYQVALQGQIVETGVGFIITLDYNQFKEIFEKKNRNKAGKRSKRMETNK